MTSRISVGGTTRSWRVISIFIVLLMLLILGTVEYAQSADPVIEIDEAVWESSDGELLLKGWSGRRARVTLADAESGEVLAKVRANRKGKWRVILRDPAEVPCHVSATSGDNVVIAFVDNAPNCGAIPALDGAEIYADKLCMHCHGLDGSGNDGSGSTGPDIQGEATPNEIRRAMNIEEVHGGIALTFDEIEAISAFLNNPVPLPAPVDVDFANPEQCGICHVRQFKEWSSSTMAYAAVSPTFSALEALGNKFSVDNGGLGFAAGNHATGLFCQSCHNPISTALGEFPTQAELEAMVDDPLVDPLPPLRDFAGDVGIQGISCVMCHQVSQPSTDTTAIGRLGDGIANTAFILEKGTTAYGPLVNPQPNPVHDSEFAQDINGEDGYLASSEFCGSCHDVRTPASANHTDSDGEAIDPVTGERFQRLENLFTEWQNGPFGPVNNEVGGVVSCQDCHMDAGPPAPAATYYGDKTSIFPRPSEATERDKVSTHYFTGVDIALVDFPGQYTTGKDEHGNNIGQVQRREDLLQSAATISITAPNTVIAGDTLPVMVNVTNVGSGHNIPSGFSQERQMWVEIILTDAASGDVLYRSGHLEDSAHLDTGELVPDGYLHDEDLRNFVGTINPFTMEADVEHGDDYNQRHGDHPVNLGLANFGNEFIRFDEFGHEEEVFMPFLSEHTNNSFSIPPLETDSVPYDIEIPADVTGPVEITARLRFRAFPPRFLRALAVGRPDLVTEEIVDRNLIVEMVTADPVSVLISP